MIKTQKILNGPVSDFEFTGFEFVSDFEIRISDFVAYN
jgi:hypothetical protein